MALMAIAAAACGGANTNAGTVRTGAGRGESTMTKPTAAASGLPRVVIMGTSLTAGYGLETSDAYPALVQRKADSAGVAVRVVNAGVSGETSAGALRRADWVLREPPDLFILETGANDGLRGQPVDALEANLRAIIAKARARAPGAQIALVQMEAMSNLGSAYQQSFHDVYPRVAEATGATLLPFLLDHVAGKRELNQADGVHPNEAGEAIVADNVWRAVRPLFEALARGRPGVAAAAERASSRG
jgi:acyl-CoA thioesterase I